jgi:ParB family transcriptional regulator, chromosome partitioning protein
MTTTAAKTAVDVANAEEKKDHGQVAAVVNSPVATLKSAMTENTPAVAADKRRALGRGLESLLPGGLRDNRAGWSTPATNVRESGNGAPSVAGTVAGLSHSADHRSIVLPPAYAQSATAAADAVEQIALDKIDHNPYQTRESFDEVMLEELASSIKSNGVVQPIMVRPGKDARYVLILGERRCRASKIAGKATIPAIVRRVSDQQAAEMTVVENLQRQDLNCIEQAAAFAKLSREFGLTQEQIGQRVGLSRESISNHMRLLKLPNAVINQLRRGALGFSEARELLKLEDGDLITRVANDVVEKHWSLHHLLDVIEGITLKRSLEPEQPASRGARWVDPNVRAAQQELERILGVRVRIRDRRGKGRIVIEYSRLEDFDRVVGMLKGNE